MSANMNFVIHRELSPNGRFSVEVSMPNEDTPYFGVIFCCVDGSCGTLQTGGWFGPFPPASADSFFIRWDLPDNVCGLYLGSDCYGLFRVGAGRRRNRGWYRVVNEQPFSQEEIAWFCSKTHVQFRCPDR